MSKSHAYSDEIQEKVNKWMKTPFDKNTQKQVKDLLNSDQNKLIDAFYKDLSFGTAGLRGVMGVGTNRINIYTIRAATQGLANYILQQKTSQSKKASVVIGHDCRHNSRLFAEESAKVLLANGIDVFLSKDICPTPFVSFMCREKKSIAAIMITASHNPPEYNGYKVYWENGAQITPPHDAGIIKEVQKIKDISMVKVGTLDNCHILDEQDDFRYIKALANYPSFPVENKKQGEKLKILYSPLHGVGYPLLVKALNSWGFTSVSLVEKQQTPDGSFPNAPSPNPEEANAMALGSEQMLANNLDIFLATDPDADRIGVVVCHNNETIKLTGNQIAALCSYYLLSTYQTQNRLLDKHCIISTIVTTRLLQKMCSKFGVRYLDTLTGFKYIGEKIHEFESNHSFDFLFGAEESYGYLLGTHARDKDGLVAACLLAEMALMLKLQKKTLVDMLEAICFEFGSYFETQHSLKFSGKEGLLTMNKQIQALRDNPPKTLDEVNIVKIDDYEKQEKTSLPKSNVLALHLEDESLVIVRPSGTEPKLKIYLLCHSDEKNFSLGQKKLNVSAERKFNDLKNQYFSKS